MYLYMKYKLQKYYKIVKKNKKKQQLSKWILRAYGCLSFSEFRGYCVTSLAVSACALRRDCFCTFSSTESVLSGPERRVPLGTTPCAGPAGPLQLRQWEESLRTHTIMQLTKRASFVKQINHIIPSRVANWTETWMNDSILWEQHLHFLWNWRRLSIK